MKKIWARIGISLDISDDEWKELLERSSDGKDEITLTEEEANRFVKNGKVDGDSYIPEYALFRDDFA